MDVRDLQQRIDRAMGARGLGYWRVRVGGVEITPAPLVVARGMGSGDALPADYSPAESVYQYTMFVPHQTAAALPPGALEVGARWELGGPPWVPVLVTEEPLVGPVGYELTVRRLGRDEV